MPVSWERFGRIKLEFRTVFKLKSTDRGVLFVDTKQDAFEGHTHTTHDLGFMQRYYLIISWKYLDSGLKLIRSFSYTQAQYFDFYLQASSSVIGKLSKSLSCTFLSIHAISLIFIMHTFLRNCLLIRLQRNLVTKIVYFMHRIRNYKSMNTMTHLCTVNKSLFYCKKYTAKKYCKINELVI